MDSHKPALSDTEQAFATAVVEMVEQIGAVQAAAQAVQASGGNARAALLASVDDEEDRNMLALQWPMIAMMLGLPPS